MTAPRRFLIVEDELSWRNTFRRDLRALVPDAHVEEAPDYEEGVRRIGGGAFDVVIVDLLLPRTPAHAGDEEVLGPQLARLMREDPRNGHAGLLVITAFATPERARDAFFGTAADDFIDKYGYTSEGFQAALRGALRGSVLRRARNVEARETRLEIQASATAVTEARMVGPRRASFPCRPPLPLAPDEWTAKGDALNLVLLGKQPGAWREQAREVGQALFEHLSSAPDISAGLASARAAGGSADELCVRLCGPASLIGVPFELMQDGSDEYLVFRHRMIRSVTRGPGAVWRHTTPFYRLVEAAAKEGTPLRALVVGANTDGTLVGAEEEARRIAALLVSEFGQLGVRCEVTALIGPDATLANVKEVLSAHGTHLFHYAGHGRFDGAAPEASGLVLASDAGPVSLRASDLFLLAKDSPLSLVFLSCCLSARSAVEAGRGDFGGVFDALARADVSTILGYRWVVNDSSALALASDFYGWLFRTLSPSEALFRAREGIALQGAGWNDETWLSPILIVQNP